MISTMRQYVSTSKCHLQASGVNYIKGIHTIVIMFRIENGPDSAVSIVTRYGLDDGGSNPGGDEIFHTLPDRPCDPSSIPYNGYWVSFPGVKRPGRDVEHPPHLALRLKKR